MVARMTLVLLLLAAKSIYWVLEQPGSSLMSFHPKLVKVGRFFGWTEVRTWMCEYGGWSPKATILRGSAPWFCKLGRKVTPANRERDRESA